MTTRETPPAPRPSEPMTEQRIDFAYTVYWTKMARAWAPERRRQVAARVAALIASADFINNAFERKFTVEGLDDTAHSGASLLALKKVLEAMA